MDTTPDAAWRFEPGRIVIPTLKRAHEECARYPLTYVTAIRMAGGTSAVLSPYDEVCEEQATAIPKNVELLLSVPPGRPGLLEGAGGLLLPGGGDLEPGLYGQEPHPRTHNVNPLRDEFEIALARAALDLDMPVLAICRGMQLLNVALGGTLDQHLADQPQRLEHDRDRPRAEAAHGLRLQERSALAGMLKTARTGINSHHHQSLDRIAPPLRETGWAEDGVLEAVESSGHSWVVGVQWHPEVMAPVESRQLTIFSSFVIAAEAFANRLAATSARSA